MNPNALQIGCDAGAGGTMRRSNSLWMLLLVVGIPGFAALASAQKNPAAKAEGTGVSRPAEFAGPRIELGLPFHDFGRIRQGDVVRYDFVFKNAGTEPLEIASVTPGCGCTTVGNWDRRVEPGG